MQVVLVSGSRSSNGLTSRALRALAEGVHAGGGRCEYIVLPKLRIERCRHCRDLLGGDPCECGGHCAIDDDFESVVERLRQADAVAFASCVYLSRLAGPLCALLHRLQQICRHDQTRRGIGGTTAVGICVGGGADQCARRLTRALAACDLDVLGVIATGRGELHLKLDLLRQAGRRLADPAWQHAALR